MTGLERAAPVAGVMMAGVLQATWRAASEARADSRLAAVLPGLRTRAGQRIVAGTRLPVDGFLEGQTGARLALRSASSGPDTELRWDASLLLHL